MGIETLKGDKETAGRVGGGGGGKGFHFGVPDEWWRDSIYTTKHSLGPFFKVTLIYKVSVWTR